MACFYYNRRKGTRTSAIDPESTNEVSLFNPWTDSWSEYFIWSADRLLIVALTSSGRATIAALDLNRERILRIRAANQEVGRHPPPDDPI